MKTKMPYAKIRQFLLNQATMRKNMADFEWDKKGDTARFQMLVAEEEHLIEAAERLTKEIVPRYLKPEIQTGVR